MTNFSTLGSFNFLSSQWLKEECIQSKELPEAMPTQGSCLHLSVPMNHPRWNSRALWPSSLTSLWYRYKKKNRSEVRGAGKEMRKQGAKRSRRLNKKQMWRWICIPVFFFLFLKLESGWIWKYTQKPHNYSFTLSSRLCEDYGNVPTYNMCNPCYYSFCVPTFHLYIFFFFFF